MPARSFHPSQWTAEGLITGLTVPPGVVKPTGAFLRRIGSDGTTFGFDGEPTAEAVFTTPIVFMDRLTEIFGVQVALFDRGTREALEGHLAIQVTLDGGVTYLAWTGAAWAAQAIGGLYTERDVFDENSATLPLPTQGAEVGFRVKLTAGDDDPGVLNFWMYCEWDHRVLLDIYETLKLTVNGVGVMVENRHTLRADSDTITFAGGYTPNTAQPAEVYNLTDDPTRSTNLFDSWAGNSITMTAQQDAGDVLLYRYYGVADVVIGQLDELVDLSEIPKTIIFIDPTSQVEQSHSGLLSDLKIGTTTRLVRQRYHHPIRRVPLRLEHWSSNPRHAAEAAGFLRERVENLVSRATGDQWRLHLDVAETLIVTRGAGLFQAAWSGEILIFDRSAPYVEYPMVSEVVITPTGPKFRWSGEVVTITS